MRRRFFPVAIVLMLLCGVAGGTAADVLFAFGGGGPGLGLFMPDLADINVFVEGSGFTPFDGGLLLIGGGGRGGVMPGAAYGGAGWGAWIESDQDARHAEYGLGLGGFDIGYAAGGAKRSILAVGMLLGGGAAELLLREEAPSATAGLTPHGIIPQPLDVVYDSVFVFVAPYIDMQIQLLDWIGLSVRAGYIWAPLEFNWSDVGPFDPPRLIPSGVYFRCSIEFGGITALQ